LVVEYELPTVEVVPGAQSYRYVEDDESVVATVRPTAQIKTLYASVIAQLTLLAVAAIVECDSERRVDAVVFNGVVDTVDPQTGQRIRPCLIAVRVTADALSGIDLRDVDASACLERLSATVSGDPAGLVSVRPMM
jgi:restriction system protein